MGVAKLRAPMLALEAQPFYPEGYKELQEGQAMEYLSATRGGWVPCTVLETREDGCVRLDVKAGYWMRPSEQVARLRAPTLALEAQPFYPEGYQDLQEGQ